MYRPLLALFLCTALLSAQTPKESEKSLYFPTKEGTKLVYEVKRGDGSKYEFTETIAKVEAKGDVFRISIEHSNSKTKPSQVIEVSAKGIHQVAVAGKDLAVPKPLLKLPAKEGEKWTVKPQFDLKGTDVVHTIGKEEEIEVPAGKFKAIPIERKAVNPGKGAGVSTTWYAPGVGIVKERVTGGMEQTRVLKSLTPGK